jgi:hypothetical protein
VTRNNEFTQKFEGEVPDDGVEVAPKRVGLINLIIRLSECIKSWWFLNYI